MNNEVFLRQLSELRSYISAAIEARKTIMPLVEDLLESMKADAICSTSGLDIRATGDGPAFKRLYAELRRRGFKRSWVSPSNGAIGASFSIDGCAAKLYVYMSFPECRVVQVGTKEVPVYETICGGSPMPTAEELEAA